MQLPLKILHIEDVSTDAEMVHRVLKKSGMHFVTHVVDSRQSFIDGIRDFEPHIILSDHSLPQFDSLEALKTTQELGINVPFILVTGAVSEEYAALCIREGADDYILKSNLLRLPMAIDNAIKKKEAEHEREMAIKQYMSKNKELNTFLYKATHDLRGPLSSIIGLTQLAKNDEKGFRNYLEMIEDSARRLDAILLSLIHTMSINEAKINITEIDFETIVQRIIKDLRFLDGFEDTQIHYDIDAHIQYRSDEKIIISVLQNLIENAIKYRDGKKNSYIDISIKQKDQEIIITIKDNGIGIPAEILNKVFDMFYRGVGGKTGSGLGLYIVRNGIEKLQGHISLESTYMEGSTFTIVLPLHPELDINN